MTDIIMPGGSLDRFDTKEKIKELESRMKAMPQIELGLTHYFADGLYAREMRVPAGTLISGYIHTTKTIGVLASGTMAIWNDDGTKTTVSAPFTHVGRAGRKRVGYALTDITWITVHKTDLRDLHEIEREQFEIEDGSMFDFDTGRVKPKEILDRHDYKNMLEQYGIDNNTVILQSENNADRIDIDLSAAGAMIRESSISGSGIFPTKTFHTGDVIGPALLDNKRTQLGRYVNHSVTPNAKMARHGNNIYLISLKEISEEEITTDYRHTLSLSGIFPCEDGGKTCQQ